MFSEENMILKYNVMVPLYNLVLFGLAPHTLKITGNTYSIPLHPNTALLTETDLMPTGIGQYDGCPGIDGQYAVSDLWSPFY